MVAGIVLLAAPDWGSLVIGPLQKLLEQLAKQAPTAIGALGVLLGAWLLARLTRTIVERLLGFTRLDGVIEATVIGRVLRGFGDDFTPSRALATLAYATILLLGITGAADLVGLTAVREALNGVLAYLPKVVSALAILAVGGYLGSAARKAVGAVLQEMKSGYAGLAEAAAETAIITLTAAIAVDVLGVDLSFITGNLAILVGIAVVTVATLFGLAARRPAEEILANYYLRRLVAVGDRVRIGEVEGKVLRFVPLGLMLRDASGEEVFVPARNVLDGLRRTPAGR